MTEPDTSVDTAEEPITNQPSEEVQQFIEDLVTETTAHKKEFSVSINRAQRSASNSLWRNEEDLTLSEVADTIKDVVWWVNEVNDEEWELNQFELSTTIVAQRTETEEDDSENDPTSE
jgi:hypothetical protein